MRENGIPVTVIFSTAHNSFSTSFLTPVGFLPPLPAGICLLSAHERIVSTKYQMPPIPGGCFIMFSIPKGLIIFIRKENEICRTKEERHRGTVALQERRRQTALHRCFGLQGVLLPVLAGLKRPVSSTCHTREQTVQAGHSALRFLAWKISGERWAAEKCVRPERASISHEHCAFRPGKNNVKSDGFCNSRILDR